MSRIRTTGAEQARNQLADLLTAAERGSSTIITKHGRPVAAIVPVGEMEGGVRQHSLLAARGTGKGLWGESSSRTLRGLRDEWTL